MADNTDVAPEKKSSGYDPFGGKRFPHWVDKTFEYVLAFVLFAELVILLGNIVLRVFLGQSFAWSGDIASIALMTLTFIGGTIAYYKGEHVSVRMLVGRFSAKWQALTNAFVAFIIMGMGIAGTILNYTVIMHNMGTQIPMLRVPEAILYMPFEIGMILLIIFGVKSLTQYKLKTIITSFVAVLGLLLIWYCAQNFLGPWNGADGFVFAGVLLFGLIAIGLPIGFVLPVIAYLYLVSSQSAPLDAVPVAMTHGISGFVMLAIPFFILAGYIMTEGGLARPLSEWVNMLIGRIRGGLMYVVVVSIIIFSGISGSKVADIAAIGTTMKDMLKKKGYKPAEYTALMAASGVMSETIPPSIPLLVLPAITTLSLGAFFVAGLGPGIFMAICMAVYVFFKARKDNWPRGERVPLLDLVKMTLRALPALLLPLILVVGIAGGVATPTEVSSFAVVYGIVVSLFYTRLRFSDVVKIFAHAGVVAGMILLMISAGSCFSWALTIGGLPGIINNVFSALGGSQALFLLITVISLVIMGGVLEGMPAILIFAPLLLPVAEQMGISGIQYGIILIFSMGLGTFIPPFGLCYYITCSIGETTSEELLPKYWPYILVLFVGILLVTYIPGISLGIPKMLGLLK